MGQRNYAGICLIPNKTQKYSIEEELHKQDTNPSPIPVRPTGINRCAVFTIIRHEAADIINLSVVRK